MDYKGFFGSSCKDQNCGSYEQRPPSRESSVAFELWRASTSKNDPCLEGYSLEEVRRHAKQIQLKQVFHSFNEFEFALDCWCLLSYRAKHCTRSKKWYQLRICRYGAKIKGKGLPVFNEDKPDSGSKTSTNGQYPQDEDTPMKNSSFVCHSPLQDITTSIYGIYNMSGSGGLEENIQECSTIANHKGNNLDDVRGQLVENGTVANVNQAAVNVCGPSTAKLKEWLTIEDTTFPSLSANTPWNCHWR